MGSLEDTMAALVRLSLAILILASGLLAFDVQELGVGQELLQEVPKDEMPHLGAQHASISVVEHSLGDENGGGGLKKKAKKGKGKAKKKGGKGKGKAKKKKGGKKARAAIAKSEKKEEKKKAGKKAKKGGKKAAKKGGKKAKKGGKKAAKKGGKKAA